MPSSRRIKFTRFFERLLLIVLLVGVGGLAFLYTEGKLETYELYAGGGIAVVILLVLLVIQSKVDSWVKTAIFQNVFSQSDAFVSMYERSPVAYLTVENNGVITECNPATVHLLQGDINTMKGVNFFDLCQENEETNPTVLRGKVDAGNTVNDLELPITTMVGRTVWVMLSIYKSREQNKRLISLVDVTEKKIVDKAKSEFVALATHQLRTPIAAIRWNVELLQKNMKDIQDEKQARYLTKINRNVFRMIHLINDFLSVSKLEMGTFSASEEDINLSDFFSSILDEFTEKITEKQIVVDRHDTPPQLTIKTDSRLFHIIVSNLVSNAVKYSNPNGTLSFSYELKGQSLEIIVADNGIGVPESEIENLFTKFYRASNAQAHQTEGTGLGLYIVKQSVEQLGGVISVESGQDKGAKFVAVIPVAVVSAN